MLLSETFEPDPAAVGTARRFVVSVMQRWGLPAGDIPLLVSELATNAVLHARSEFSVAVSAGAGWVRVEVSDGNSRVPVLASVPPDAYSGRGLLLLQSLATSWGVDQRRQDGKTVWFEVALPVRSPEVAPAF